MGLEKWPPPLPVQAKVLWPLQPTESHWCVGNQGRVVGSAMSISLVQESVLQRVLQLPVVSSTCETLQRKYSSTKESHPLMASVCEVYERGVQGAGALAMWGMEPVVRRLEPQCECVLGGDVAGGPPEPPLLGQRWHKYVPGTAQILF